MNSSLSTNIYQNESSTTHVLLLIMLFFVQINAAFYLKLPVGLADPRDKEAVRDLNIYLNIRVESQCVICRFCQMESNF